MAIDRVEAITGAFIPFYESDIRDRERLNIILDMHQIDCCINFSGLKAVGESVMIRRS